MKDENIHARQTRRALRYRDRQPIALAKLMFNDKVQNIPPLAEIDRGGYWVPSLERLKARHSAQVTLSAG